MSFIGKTGNCMVGGTLVGAVMLAVLPGCVGGFPRSSPPAILELNMTNDPARVNGQPVVAVNPKNPRNLVLISANHLPNMAVIAGAKPGVSLGGEAISEFNCLAAWSDDGGATWTRSEFPRGDSPRCGDPYLAVDSQGTFFTAFNRLGGPRAAGGPMSVGGLGVASSRNGGHTWSAPVTTPAGVVVTPRLRVDAATDKIYAVGSKGGASDIAVTVSADHGLTWAPPELLPKQPFGNQVAVHDGILVTATATAIADGTVVPSELRFYASTDDGKTFTSYPVTDSRGHAVQPPSGDVVPNNKTLRSTDPVPFVSADPTRKGRFALMIPRGDNLEVYVTPDAGSQWVGPTVIAAPGAAKPWMDYGTQGLLGVMWRTLGRDMVDAYSTISRDGGGSFSPPLKVNQASHKYGFPGSGGDEWSRILIDDTYAYVTWADGRGGGAIDGILARVPLALYRRPRR